MPSIKSRLGEHFNEHSLMHLDRQCLICTFSATDPESYAS